MADEVHEAPIIHSRLSCSAMAVVELSRGVTITGVDTTVLDSDNLLEGNIAHQALLQNMPREFNVDISDLSTTPVVSEQNTFTSGGVSVVDGIYRVEVPSNGIYNVDVLSNNMLTAQHKVLKLGDSFAEMTSPFNFQSGSSFSIDFEWRGTTISGVGIDVPIVSTSQFSLSCEQLSSSSYGVRLTVNDGASSIMIPADRYELHKDVWYNIGIVWFSAENSLFLYIDKIHVFSGTLTTFGAHTARPFTFGKNLTSGVTGGDYEFKWIRYHQSPLHAKQMRDLIAPLTLDVDGFRSAVVYTGAESSPTIPTIQKNSAVLENIPSSDYDATISIVVGDLVGGSIVGEIVKTIVANSYANDIPLNATVLAKSGQFITINAHNISPISFKVFALKTDNVIIPNIVLSGSDVLLQRTQTYSDPGFSATEVDSLSNSSDMTSSVVMTGSVDELNVGLYTIQYTLTSSDNLLSVTKMRKVTVIDTVHPVIVMTGSSTITHERGTTYNDLGAVATDGNIDMTSRISVHNTVNQNIVGTYTVTYNTVDSRGNVALPVVRTVNVVDTTSPVITVLTGSNGLISQTVERLDSYTDPGATATDYPGNEDLTPSIQVGFIRNMDNAVLSEVDVTTVGTYTITYSATDAAGNTATATRTVIVEDSINPIVTLQSAHENPYYIEVGTGSYTEYGATAADGNGGESLSVVTTGTVNTNAVGTYTKYYTATDSTGRSGQASRQVIVRDTVAPTVSLIGDATVEIEAGSVASYVDAGVNASDASGTVNITTDHNIDINTPGSYTFTHTVSDGTNQTQVSRTVIVSTSSSASSGMILPVTSGLLAHYSWYSWKNTTTWEDLSGNGNHMTNVSAGTSALVTAENANMTDNDTGARFPYIAGNTSSQWDMAGLTGAERLTQNSWTYIHIHRYDPAGSDYGRILGVHGDDALFGTFWGYVGNSFHAGWLGGGDFPGHNYVPPRFGGHWVFHIERPGTMWRTTTKDSAWTGPLTGGNPNMSFRPTLNAANSRSDWNVAELILFNRKLSDAEVESFKTWLMDYKAGNIHDNYTSYVPPVSAPVILGLPWTMVKRVEPGSVTWHPGADDLAGTYVTGTQGTGTWSIAFSSTPFTHFLVAHLADDGISPRAEGPWLICTKETARDTSGSGAFVSREVLYSSESLEPYMVQWIRVNPGISPPRHPLFGSVDFHDASTSSRLVFGEDSHGNQSMSNAGNVHAQRGAGVWIINDFNTKLSTALSSPAATIYWWGGNYPHLTLFWNTSQRNYYNYSVYNSFDYFKSSLPSHYQTTNTGTLDIGDQNVGDQNIHIEFAAGTVSNIRIRGQISSTAYAFWTGSQWEGQTMANGNDSTGRHNMNHNEHLVWTNNDGTYADLNIVPPSNATQLGLLNGDDKKYILVEIS
jgi:hypothetical protein